jgi:hypothetical protein
MRPYNLHENPLFHHNVESKRIDATWVDYLQDCGGDKIIDNYVHTKMVFNQKYENYKVEWTGYFAEVKTKSKPLFPWSQNDHELLILVKMEPSESNIFADLVLSVSTGVYKKEKVMFDSLKKGEGIHFEAVIVGLGSEYKMHHLHAQSVSKTSTFKQLDEIIVRESALP